MATNFSIELLYPGRRNSLYVLEADGFTKLNFIPGTTVNSLLDANTPRGVLGGSVAGLAGNLVVGAGNAAKKPLGIYINNAVGNPFENTPAIGSGIAPFMNQFGSYRIFVWETHDAAGMNAHLYAPGNVLYCSANGLLTKEAAGGAGGHADPLAVCVKAPSASDLSMVIELRV